MTSDESATGTPSLRRRRRAVAVGEILTAAECHIVEHGPAALSLRAVARSLAMTVQALYHYFPSRDHLVTALVTKAYDDLADAVQAAVDSAPDDTVVPRLVLAAEGYRGWANANPERFQLIYGTPLRHYEAPVEGPTTQALRRMSAIFRHELFGEFSTAQLAAADTPELSSSLQAHLEHLPPDALGSLPPPAASLFLSAWGHMHGLVVLEVFGHTAFIGAHQAEVFRAAMRNMLEDVHSRIPTGRISGEAWCESRGTAPPI
ncbi:TetR/AcrR family transcriptional regulator [Rhizohabitans arisaemae]|uniref:TetR/AcrR family transcriptional regulator n=1 Tax=Rhizohabitans arisaemae TaxID=2720610 RepID=UPI0024B14050|nr:TetR/AcrR family transcriptional regulator [Rhizohabitans arisaemae]